MSRLRTPLLALLLCGLAACAPDPGEFSGDNSDKADLIGNSGPDEGCSFDYECQADHPDGPLICRPAIHDGVITDECQRVADEGTLCDEDGDCNAGLFCGDDPNDSSQEVCQPGTADSCTYDFQCSFSGNIVCRPTVANQIFGSPHCLAPGLEGDTCAESGDCAPGLRCRNARFLRGNLLDAGQCQVGSDSQCTFNDQCLDDTAVCRPSSDATDAPDLRCRSTGEARDLCDEDADCAPGLTCGGAQHYETGFIKKAGICE